MAFGFNPTWTSTTESSTCSTRHRLAPPSASTSKKRVGHALAGDFIRAKTVDAAAHSGSGGPSVCQRLTKKLRKTNYVNNSMVLVVLLDAYCNAASIDARAAGNQTPQLWTVLSDVCLVLYSLELAMLLSSRPAILKSCSISLRQVMNMRTWEC